MSLRVDPPSDLVVRRGRLRDVPAVADWMSGDERRTLDAMRTAARRRSWTLGRWTAKQALMGLPQVSAEMQRWSVLAAPDGAPEAFLDGLRQPISVSLSHRAGAALAVAAPYPRTVGCDLERIEPRSDGFIQDFLTAREREWVEAAEGTNRHVRANLVWSGKEAALKVVREGLRRDTRSVVVELHEPPSPSASGADAWHPFAVHDTVDGYRCPAWYRIDAGFVEVLAAR